MDINLDSVSGIPNDYYLNNIIGNPILLIIITIIIVVYYLLFASLGGDTTMVTGDEYNGMAIIEIILWVVFVVLLLLNGIAYIYNIDVVASIKDIFSDTPKVDVVINKKHRDDTLNDGIFNDFDIKKSQQKREKQVFYIPDNKYSYTDAKAVCKAYGSRLANYKEIEEAYKQGADWCGYGWSEDQMALYPTQYEKWQELQGRKGHEHDCGRPGINGGYIGNEGVKFGINCYGYKPDITPDEAEQMQSSVIYQKTQKEINFDKKVDYWRNKLSDILIAPFNHNNWSIF